MSGEATDELTATGTDAAAKPSGLHFLESEWVLWEHRSPDKNSKSYEDNMEKLCEILERDFMIPKNRVYVEFVDMERENCGYDGATFGG